MISENTPVDRIWASMSPIQTGKEEGGLLIYGGKNNIRTILGDCWRIDLEQQPSSWVRCPHLELGPRLEHASVLLESQVMVIGGCTNIAKLAEHVSSDVLNPLFVYCFIVVLGSSLKSDSPLPQGAMP